METQLLGSGLSSHEIGARVKVTSNVGHNRPESTAKQVAVNRIAAALINRIGDMGAR